MANYTSPLPNYGDLMTVDEFKHLVDDGTLMNYDGFGFPVKDDLRDCSITIKPSRVEEIPEDATHIHWYNR